MGVTFFDTGDVYGRRGGSETIIGEVLGARRKDIVLATKFGRPMDAEGKLQGGSRAYIMFGGRGEPEATEDRLDRPLPVAQARSTDADRGDAARARRSRARGQGARHRLKPHAGGRGADAQRTARTHRLTALLPAARTNTASWSAASSAIFCRRWPQEGLSLLPYYPLASGVLTGKYQRGAPLPEDSRFAVVKERDYMGHFFTDANWQQARRAARFRAAQRGLTILQVAMAWIAARPQVASVIAGATKPEQVAANVKAAQTELSADDIAELDRITG